MILSPEEARRGLLRFGRELLKLHHGPDGARSPITVIVCGVGVGPLVVSTETPAESSPLPPPPPLAADLSPLQRDILAAVGPRPLTSKILATRAGRVYNSSFRTSLAQLVEMGHIRRTRSGYTRV
jgi:hypothetical protein